MEGDIICDDPTKAHRIRVVEQDGDPGWLLLEPRSAKEVYSICQFCGGGLVKGNHYKGILGSIHYAVVCDRCSREDPMYELASPPDPHRVRLFRIVLVAFLIVLIVLTALKGLVP